MAIAAAASALPLEVRVEGKPAARFGVRYFNGSHMLHAVTDAHGIAVLAVKTELPKWNLWPESSDYVFRNLRTGGRPWQVDAVRSAKWRQRTRPRPCDAWRDIMDIPRGTLHDESAACVTLRSIEARVGSKAPWYLYELEGLEPACVNGRFVGELDWVSWYRRLLEKATGASPGKCLSDWKRWWAAKGYPPVPARSPR
jgi:hypothetical protein